MAENVKCTIFDIKKYAIHDGPGIRTTLFFKGCPMSCIWCHNPEGISMLPEVVYDSSRCIGCGECVAICPEKALTIHSAFAMENSGNDTEDLTFFNETSDSVTEASAFVMKHSGSVTEGSVSVVKNKILCAFCGECVKRCPSTAQERVGKVFRVAELLQLIENDLPFYETSGGGVTFSGGEPLMQWKALLALLKGCKDLDIHTAVDTSGFASRDVIRRVAPYTDLFLFDLKIMDDNLHRKYTGVSNEMILSNLELLALLGASVIIRIPLIHKVNDDDKNLNACGSFLASLTGIKDVNLLPFHDFQKSKYKKFGITYRAENLSSPTESGIADAIKKLSSFGLNVNC
ncbi:PflC2 [Desulfamplus magnetovallimortis]|uniref:PflC2 n=1 Tax=Desulfamplus magnetovallimortis TaxID=1246637 RepID=A0A1W1HBG8_9BACT|nr:glycyl-radical enzyme activating protein [Desulfamplus magnetovallimortis]SLM29841.1 PflC2 [Desulfamplus magnetovallimortis]